MAKLIFENQGRLSKELWGNFADDLKPDRMKFDAALNSQNLKAKIDRDEIAAAALKLPGTPSFFLKRRAPGSSKSS